MKIKGHKWQVYLVTAYGFKRAHGKMAVDTIALADKAKREIWFQDTDIELSHVRHEVFHAFMSECRIDSANLTAEQMEEIAAEIVGDDFEQINRMSRKIFRWLKKHDKNARTVKNHKT